MNAAVTALKEAARNDETLSELATGFGHFFGAPLKNGPGVDEQEPVEYCNRSYTQQITFWTFLFQVLTPGCACREVVRRVQLWWRDRDPQKPISSDTGAYCRARLRLPFVWLEQLQQALVSRLAEHVDSLSQSRGRRPPSRNGLPLNQSHGGKQQT